MKRYTLLFLAIIIVFFGMTGCGKYSSRYNAVLLVSSNDTDSASVSFHKFDGTEVFNLKCENGKTAKIQYSGKLETGSLTAYYDCGEEKTALFSLQSGEEINACSDQLVQGKVYIIIETSEECQDGACRFEVIYD